MEKEKTLTVKELKKMLEKFDENATVILDYACEDCWYDYYGSDINVISDNDNNCILEVVN
jgi:hypothetical protein